MPERFHPALPGSFRCDPMQFHRHVVQVFPEGSISGYSSSVLPRFDRRFREVFVLVRSDREECVARACIPCFARDPSINLIRYISFKVYLCADYSSVLPAPYCGIACYR